MTTLNICQSNLVSLASADRRKMLADMRAFGFVKVRFEVPLHAQLFAGQKYNWDPLRNTMADIENADMEALPVLGAHLPIFWKPTATQYATWAATALAVAQVAQLVRQVEVWNEPNLSNFWPKADPVSFYPFAQAAYDAIKAVYPNTEVILSGLAASTNAKPFLWTGGTKDPVAFLAAMTSAAQGRKYFDRLAYHAYSVTEGWASKRPAPDVFGISRLASLQILDPELIVTEFGFNDANASSYIVDQMIQMKTVPEAYLFNWRDADGEKFGLVDAKNKPKQPYYDTVKALVR